MPVGVVEDHFARALTAEVKAVAYVGQHATVTDRQIARVGNTNVNVARCLRLLGHRAVPLNASHTEMVWFLYRAAVLAGWAASPEKSLQKPGGSGGRGRFVRADLLLTSNWPNHEEERPRLVVEYKTSTSHTPSWAYSVGMQVEKYRECANAPVLVVAPRPTISEVADAPVVSTTRFVTALRRTRNVPDLLEAVAS